MASVTVIMVICQVFHTALGQTGVPAIFYPFGPEEGDQALLPNDDSFSELVPISMDFPFFDKVFSTLYVNNNGGVSFQHPISSYTPEAFPLGETYTFIAVFWADVDTRFGQGYVYYREVTDPDLLNRITSDILEEYGSRGLSHFKAEWAYVVTWYQVGAYGGDYSFSSWNEHNTFQLAISTDGRHSFAIFNYGDIMWTYGTASDGIPAQVGFNAGDGVNYFAVPGSRTLDIADIQYTSNVGIPGRWIFRIDQATISAGNCLDINSTCGPHQLETLPGVCEDIAPAIDGCPNLSDPVLVDELYVYFYCEIIHYYTDGAVFEVNFLFDGVEDVSIPTFVIRGAEQSVALHEKYLYGNLGKRVSCQVVSYFESSPETKSSAIESNSYYAGIQASEPYLRVYEGDDTATSIYLKSTLPIACSTTVNDSPIGCKHNFKIDSSDNIVVFQPGKVGEEEFTCLYRLDTSDWKPSERASYSLQHPIYVYPTVSLTTDPPSIEYIRFESLPYLEKEDEEGNFYTYMWNDYIPPPITVYRYESSWGSGATCYSTGDPRITTFDEFYYDAYAVGQFVMVRSSNPRGFEVQARHEPCTLTTTVACVCGLAIQEGNDSIILDMCKNKPLQKGHRTASSNGKLSDGMELTCNKLGNEYTIQTPSGALANIYVNSWGMTVTLHIPSQDFQQTEGLCGTYDNNPYNDLKFQGSDFVADLSDSSELNGFVQSWRIPPGQSLFDRPPTAVKPEIPTANQYCHCSLRALDELIPCEGTFDPDTYTELKRGTVTVPTGNIIDNLVIGAGRRKRDTEEESSYVNYDYDPSDFDHALDSVNNLEFFWPTLTGITEEEAEAYCRNRILLSPVYIACENYTDNIDEIVAKCIEDVKVSSSFENWAEDKLDEIHDGCKMNILQFFTSSSENVTESRSQILNLLQSTLYDVCPNQCSGHGHCSHSVCSCEEGYEGEDCSVDSSSLPNALSFLNNGLCDTSVRECTNVVVVVENILYTETLSCRVEVKGRGEVTTRAGTFEGFGQVRCEVPTGDTNELTYQVSVSRNGEHYGSHQEMLVYDGTCLECDQNGCEIQENMCSINGWCYSSGEQSADDSCQVCDPYEDSHGWSLHQDCKKDWTLVIVLAVLVPVILFILILCSLCIIKKKKNRKTASSNVREQPELDVYVTGSRPTTAGALSVDTADGRNHVWGEKEEGFDCRPVLTTEGSFVGLPPINHVLTESYFDKMKK